MRLLDGWGLLHALQLLQHVRPGLPNFCCTIFLGCFACFVLLCFVFFMFLMFILPSLPPSLPPSWRRMMQRSDRAWGWSFSRASGSD